MILPLLNDLSSVVIFDTLSFEFTKMQYSHTCITDHLFIKDLPILTPVVKFDCSNIQRNFKSVKQTGNSSCLFSFLFGELISKAMYSLTHKSKVCIVHYQQQLCILSALLSQHYKLKHESKPKINHLEHIHISGFYQLRILFILKKLNINVYVLSQCQQRKQKKKVTGMEVQPFLDCLNATESPGKM